MKNIYEKILLNDFQKAGSCYLLSVPYIVWDYEHNEIYEVRLLAFSEDRSVCYHIMIGWKGGKLDEVSEQFDFDRMGVSFQKATDLDVCVKVDLSQLQ